MAVFVNSSDALVEWNSIPINRYDVRHLLSSPPPPRRRHHHIVDSFESELNQERYLDLSYNQQGQFRFLSYIQIPKQTLYLAVILNSLTVAFSYGNSPIHRRQAIYGAPGTSQFSAELSDKLEKTEKKLHETELALADLEERHKQANATIKEKEYLISNLIKSGKLNFLCCTWHNLARGTLHNSVP
ncbi:hypothetical protein POM88_007007 [Heracleum sosnowskyi]|uniref:Suppressor of white apricot N-terminal domain-containing protein n=1 Tax=Heracleum sosnowskyi TaxID=360622 RepID=A0AAD8N580_9APIA|nr:hypothetical protein POM88_007007 [Heracleum sosnowskyi]